MAKTKAYTNDELDKLALELGLVEAPAKSEAKPADTKPAEDAKPAATTATSSTASGAKSSGSTSRPSGSSSRPAPTSTNKAKPTEVKPAPTPIPPPAPVEPVELATPPQEDLPQLDRYNAEPDVKLAELQRYSKELIDSPEARAIRARSNSLPSYPGVNAVTSLQNVTLPTPASMQYQNTVAKRRDLAYQSDVYDNAAARAELLRAIKADPIEVNRVVQAIQQSMEDDVDPSDLMDDAVRIVKTKNLQRLIEMARAGGTLEDSDLSISPNSGQQSYLIHQLQKLAEFDPSRRAPEPGPYDQPFGLLTPYLDDPVGRAKRALGTLPKPSIPDDSPVYTAGRNLMSPDFWLRKPSENIPDALAAYLKQYE